MEKYNYLEAVTADAKQWLLDNYEIEVLLNEEDYDTFHNEMWTADEVTGNASGSYTFSTWEAEENLCHNWDLIEDVNNKLIGDELPKISCDWEHGPEYWDMMIRCYLLREAIDNAMKEIIQEYKKE